MRTTPEPLFSFDGDLYLLSEMLASNADESDLCEWFRTAQVGQSFNDVERVA